jgi:putative hemolysin
MGRLKSGIAASGVALLLLLGGGLRINGQDSAPGWPKPLNPSPDQYCSKTGGKVLKMEPAYGTNGNNPLHLSGSQHYCDYTANDGSEIFLLTTTLFTAQPTLAALAYYAQVQPGSCQGNPASCYCTLLGGSDQFGGTAGNGGGWLTQSRPGFVLEACIFPDMSTIDSWGLFYHSANIIRGKDLSKILRYPDPYDKK